MEGIRGYVMSYITLSIVSGEASGEICFRMDVDSEWDKHELRQHVITYFDNMPLEITTIEEEVV
tara:strand:+ start:36 stop:227 length:192 start_codon:yes stop_codon:yes gene_type:complete